MATRKAAPKRTVESRLGALERLGREHGKSAHEVGAALTTLQRDVRAFREHHHHHIASLKSEIEQFRAQHQRDVEFLKTSDSLILKEMREGFGELRGDMQKNFNIVFDHLDGISKQVETLSRSISLSRRRCSAWRSAWRAWRPSARIERRRERHA
jgi:hypothetical protein